MNDDLYYITAGVRRAVAARENGLSAILADLIEDGNYLRQLVVPLDQLVSPKDRISRSDIRYMSVAILLATAAGRAKMPAIQVERLSADRAISFTPLLDVLLEP